jgi:hypothetical protein
MMGDDGIAVVRELVQQLNAQPPLTKARVNQLYEVHRASRSIDFLAPKDVQLQQFDELQKRLKSEENKDLDLLWKRSLHKDADNDPCLS